MAGVSSYRNAAKSYQKTHRERSQPAARERLGLLEKKKDYKRRADDFHAKQNTLKVLKRRALNRNPDEFYFNMVRTRTEDGEHQCEDTVPAYTPDQLKLIQSQDIKYVTYKRSVELKKIERLKASLHLLDVEDKPKNSHTIFVDSKKEAREFDAVQHLQTHPALVDRVYNRPRLDTLSQTTVTGHDDDETLAAIGQQRAHMYKELAKRIEREKQLSIIAQKMEMKKQLMDKRSHKKKVSDESTSAAAVYKWVPRRKR